MALQRKPPKRGEKPVEHRRPLGRLRLFIDDLDDVHKLLLERTKSVSLTAGNAVADAPDDLRDATRKELDQVRFVTSDPDVVVTLTSGSGSAFARTSDESAEAIKTIDDVQALLESRRNNWYFLGRTIASNLLITAALSLVVAVLVLIFPSEDLDGPINVALFALGFGGFIFVVLMLPAALLTFGTETDRARVVPERRGQARRFTAQTRTAWLVGIVGVVLTAVITAIVTYAVTQ